MADHAVIVVAGNHGAELNHDLYVYSRAKSRYQIYLCEESEFIDLDGAAVAVFPYPRRAEFVGTPEEGTLQEAFTEQLEEFNQRFTRRPVCFFACFSAISV